MLRPSISTRIDLVRWTTRPGHVAYAAVVLLLLLAAGCARAKPQTPVSEPQSVATQPGTPQPAAKPAAPSKSEPAPAPALAPSARTPAPPAAGKVAPPVGKAPAAAPALDLNALEEQLKETKAIGFLTKISLKNQVDDLLDRFGEYYDGKAKFTMTDLRRSYDLLMMKVLTLLQDQDQELASACFPSPRCNRRSHHKLIASRLDSSTHTN